MRRGLWWYWGRMSVGMFGVCMVLGRVMAKLQHGC